MIGKPSLLMLMAAASAASVVANGVYAASPETRAEAAAPKTRLGNEIGQGMSARDTAAAQRKRALDLREQAAKAAEARLKAGLEAQQQQAANTSGGGPGTPPAENEQYEDLARIYQAMKPAKAAIVFEQLEMDVQMEVAKRMRERSTALILAAMNPKAAAELSMAMARGKARPAQPRPAVTSAQARP